MNYSSISDRLKILNDGADEKEVWDSIDRPIRPLVGEINRIGVETLFSCCGFHYKDEEEPKSHSIDPFIIFREPDPEIFNIGRVKAFFDLSKAAMCLGWHFYKLANNLE